VIAIFLGWALAGEKLTGQTVLAAAIIVIAVILIVTSPTPQKQAVIAREEKIPEEIGTACLEEA
jgi:drug/metabolite transporter (DMT)-like permease